jgi:tRNA threonylcarbamoyladenosine biosynthesis protein TsaB
MITLALRTDSPEAELRLYDGNTLLERYVWYAHRALAETLTHQMHELLARHDKQLADINRVVVYSGPGSFTGLRIGVSVANALAYGLGIDVVGMDEGAWNALPDGLEDEVSTRAVVTPVYGSEPHITLPRK